MQSNKDITGDNSQVCIHSGVVNDFLAYWNDLEVIVNSSVKHVSCRTLSQKVKEC